MNRLTMFNFITLNGFYKGPGEDISWHKHAADENDFSAEELSKENILLFGRITYELMSSYWPTENALQNNPIVAERMNRADKIVFSRTLKTAEWNNTRLINENIVDEIKKLKQLPGGKDMTLLGSGSIGSLFTNHGLIDEYQVMIDPVVIPEGTSFLKDITQKTELRLIRTKTFNSGTILLCYEVCRNR